MWRASRCCVEIGHECMAEVHERKTLNMETRNKCYTYFTIVGDFDPDVITAKLGIIPNESWKKGDRRRNGPLYDFSSWTYIY